MAISMTRAEYQAKYGTAPDVSSSTQPIKMTRAEYTAKYGAVPTETTSTVEKPSIAGTLTAPLRQGISGLGTLYGGGEQGIANKLKEDIQAGASDIAQGNIIKGVAKSGLRTAGDVAGAIYAPIGAAIGATGIGKVFEGVQSQLEKGQGLLGEGISKFADIPAVQEFAMKHPNAEEDFGRALNLIFASQEKGKIEPSTAIPRTVEQVAGATKKVSSAIVEKAQSLRSAAQESLVNRVGTNLKLTPKQIQLEERYAKDTPKFLVDEGVDHLLKADGKVLDTTDAINALQIKAKAENNAFKSILQNDPRYISLDEWGRQAKINAKNTFQGSDLDSALAKIDNEITSYKIQNKNPQLLNAKGEQLVPSDIMNEIKQYKWDRTKGFGSPEAKLDADLNYQLGNAAKDAIEKAYIGDTNISQLNKRLGDFSSAIKVLSNRNGVKLSGGMLSRMAGRVVGAVAAKPLGPMGELVGALTGGKLVEILQDPQVSTFVSRSILNKLGRTKEGLSVIAEAEKLAGQRANAILNNKRLSAPSSIQMGGTSDTSGISKSGINDLNKYYEDIRIKNTPLLSAPSGAIPTGKPTIQLPKKSESTIESELNQRNSQITPTNSAISNASNIGTKSYTPTDIVKNHLDEIQEMLKDPDFAPVIKANPKQAIMDIRTDVERGLRAGNFVKEADAVAKIKPSQLKTLSDFKKALNNAVSKTSTNVEVNPLIQEAKKYKSAESLLKSKYPDVNFSIYEKNGEINLSKIIVPKEARNSGIGTKAMNDLIDYADKTNQKVTLTPSSDYGGSKTRLVDFYKKFGFVENKGKFKDFSTRELMYRLPK